MSIYIHAHFDLISKNPKFSIVLHLLFCFLDGHPRVVSFVIHRAAHGFTMIVCGLRASSHLASQVKRSSAKLLLFLGERWGGVH